MVDSYQGTKEDVEKFLSKMYGENDFLYRKILGITENNGLFTVFYLW